MKTPTNDAGSKFDPFKAEFMCMTPSDFMPMASVAKGMPFISKGGFANGELDEMLNALGVAIEAMKERDDEIEDAVKAMRERRQSVLHSDDGKLVVLTTRRYAAELETAKARGFDEGHRKGYDDGFNDRLTDKEEACASALTKVCQGADGPYFCADGDVVIASADAWNGRETVAGDELTDIDRRDLQHARIIRNGGVLMVWDDGIVMMTSGYFEHIMNRSFAASRLRNCANCAKRNTCVTLDADESWDMLDACEEWEDEDE